MSRNGPASRGNDVRYRFKTPAFELMLQWVLGMQTSGGSEIAESFQAASLVKENNPQSWVAAWTTLARQVERRAEQAIAARHEVSAGEAYLRAYVYNRAALMCIPPFSAAAEPTWHHAVDCFRRAAALMDPIAEPVSVPFEGAYLPGYFVAPADGQAKRKTLIVIGGGDTYVEDLYLIVGPAAVKRGYNLLIVDLPGQGGLPFDRLYMRPDTEGQIPAVVDYALKRPEVDEAALAACGIGYGGYILPRALSAEGRIRAAAVCRVLSDLHAGMAQSRITRWVARHRRSVLGKAIIRTMRLRPSLILMDTYAWRWGAATYDGMLDIARDFTLDPAAITFPLQSVAGEKDANPGPQSRLITARPSGGGDAHALGTNLSLMAQLVFDRLDDVLSAEPRPNAGVAA